MIAVPTDQPGSLDVEDLVCGLLEAPAGRCSPAPEIVTFIPPNYSDALADRPLIVVQRIGGAAAAADQVDVALVELGVLATTRADGWKLLGYLRSWLLSVPGTMDADRVRLVGIEEIAGPTMPAWVNPDHRWVRITLRVALRRPRR